MKYKYILTFAFFVSSCCSTTKITNTPCDENEQFKKTFFFNVDLVKKTIDKNQNEQFRKALNFISKYTLVSFENMLNYSNTYTIGAFNKDYKNWIKWYEENKCNNIQFVQ
jgi:hypothetical protein